MSLVVKRVSSSFVNDWAVLAKISHAMVLRARGVFFTATALLLRQLSQIHRCQIELRNSA